MASRSHQRAAAVAAVLSFVFPGLGQAYAGQRRLAVLLAAPVALLVIAVALGFTVFATSLRNEVLSSTFLGVVLILDAALLAWRLFAIAQAGLGRLAAGPKRGHVISTAVVIVLLALTVAMHAWAAFIVGRLGGALDEVFAVRQSPAATSAPLNVPQFRWTGTERINFLMLGIDSGPGRGEALSDTILVISVDPMAKTAVMLSVPRDTGFMPLPDTRTYADGRYPNKINALATEASADIARWCPDLTNGPDCGLRTLERSVGLYLGISIQYYARVNLAGFADLIDALGGVRLCLPGVLIDRSYTGPAWAKRGAELQAGCHIYDGGHALAYARIRKGELHLPDGTVEGQNDFKRAARQQDVLLALRAKFASANLVVELPDILDAIGRTVTTDFPRSEIGDLGTLLPLISGPHIERVVLGYPGYVDAPVDPTGNYLLIPRREAVRAEMLRLFPDQPAQGWYLGSNLARPE